MRRFSLASLVAVAFGAFALASAPSAAAVENVAANCEPPSEHVGNRPYAAQSFTPQLSGPLTRAEIEIIKTTGTGDYVVETRTMSADGPTAVLATTTVADASVPTGKSVVSATFSSPVDAVAGTQYALVVYRTGTGFETGGIGYRYATCQGGNAWFSDTDQTASSPSDPCLTALSSCWQNFQSLDLVFRVFVDRPGDGGATPGSALTCMGKRATRVGTPGNDVLTGTPGRDVIVALAGRDEVSGFAGEDLICGGRGQDTLRGGRGKDKLLGQKGRDKLRGGRGKDVCKGGARNDSAKGCEVEKSI